MDKHEFEIHSSIPVLRMLDEAKSKAFYVNYLGYEIDWEHRFNDDSQSPLYMQIHLGSSVLHLNGHAEQDSPVCEVRIPVKGLEAFHRHLSSKDSDFATPDIDDPRYEDRPADLNLYDPSGNHLVFWAPSYLAD